MTDLAVSVYQHTIRGESPSERLVWLDRAAKRASDAGSQLLICPELFVAGHDITQDFAAVAEPFDGEYAQRAGEIAQLHEIALVFGYPEMVANDMFNSVACIGADGQLLANVRKNSLQSGFDKQVFTAGEGVSTFKLGDWCIGVVIGSDIEFPEAVRQATSSGADLVVVPTSGGVGRSIVFEKMMPVRALENGVFLASANFSTVGDKQRHAGGSRIIGPEGFELAIAGVGEEILSFVLHSADIDIARAQYPYVRSLGGT